jgi:hypothetical protein
VVIDGRYGDVYFTVADILARYKVTEDQAREFLGEIHKGLEATMAEVGWEMIHELAPDDWADADDEAEI